MSNKIVTQALKALGCMEHRGGCSADRNSGDGAGIMTALPQKIFASWFTANNIPQPETEAWGVGMVFLPQDAEKNATEKKFIEETVKATVKSDRIILFIRNFLATKSNIKFSIFLYFFQEHQREI